MISPRLLQIAMMIDKNKVVYDVGSDHALLPCFLIENNISKKVYAGEISDGPFNNAKANIERYGLTDKIIPIKADGLIDAPEDVDIVIIAGMGYFTIEHILDTCDVTRYQYFIVQSNTDVDKLRRYISEHNYTIEDERVVYDDFYYQVIKFSADLHEPYSEEEIKYGPVLLKRKDEVFISYLLDYRKRLLTINEKANSAEISNTIKEIEKILYN